MYMTFENKHNSKDILNNLACYYILFETYNYIYICIYTHTQVNIIHIKYYFNSFERNGKPSFCFPSGILWQKKPWLVLEYGLPYQRRHLKLNIPEI